MTMNVELLAGERLSLRALVLPDSCLLVPRAFFFALVQPQNRQQESDQSLVSRFCGVAFPFLFSESFSRGCPGCTTTKRFKLLLQNKGIRPIVCNGLNLR